jgi:hypothetical protein
MAPVTGIMVSTIAVIGTEIDLSIDDRVGGGIVFSSGLGGYGDRQEQAEDDGHAADPFQVHSNCTP